uniref:Uncharacterized protein n=1 Tax=Siphoviridae sp. ct87j35 TaxID=2825356 RepID=A0A8S5V4I8_9CAUD|nr:MAG TPA: hypothetical protein [Siphoviridae sp. ct87j35]
MVFDHTQGDMDLGILISVHITNKFISPDRRMVAG